MSLTKTLTTQEVHVSLVDVPSHHTVTRNETILLREQSKWGYYSKPFTLTAVGLLVFLSGVILSAFYFVQVGDVPSAMGSVCLSVGLMFLVAGSVWLLITKQAVRYDGFARKRAAGPSA